MNVITGFVKAKKNIRKDDLLQASGKLTVANLIEEGRWGGPQNRISLVAKALKQYGVETTVLIPDKGADKFKQILAQDDIKFIGLPIHRLSRGLSALSVYLLCFPIDLFNLWLVLRKGGYDLLHVSGGAWQIKGVIAGRLAGVPVIWHLNDTGMPKFIRLIFVLISRYATSFIVAGKRVEQYYLSNICLRNDMVFHVPAPVDFKKIMCFEREAKSPASALHSLKIVSVCNVNPTKGLDLLVDVAALLQHEGVLFSVEIVGSVYDSQKKYYESLLYRIKQEGLNNSFKFLGACDNVASILASSDIYVCASYAEASPMSVWEAMASQCIVISTDVGDVSVYVKNGLTGFVVPVGDAHAICEKIKYVQQNYDIAAPIRENARSCARKYLDLDVIAKQTYDAYLTTLND